MQEVKENISIEDEFINVLKIIIYSFIGIFIFFIPMKINGQTLTLIYHISYKLQSEIRPFLHACITIYVILGCVKPIFIKKKSENNSIFLYLKMFSIIIIINIFYGKNTMIFLDENIALLIEELTINIATMIPVTAIFMTFLLDYGLLDIIESYLQKPMKKLFNLSGKTLINILIYIFTDCFCGMFITNKLYNTGKIRLNEACNIILNFSIISVFMIRYICIELNLVVINVVVTSIIILIIMNVILSKVYPINKQKKSYAIKTSYKETIHKNDKFKKAIKKYNKYKTNQNIFKTIINNLEESISIITRFIPQLILTLYLGQIILNSAIINEIFKYIFYPFAELFRLSDKNELSLFLINSFYNPVISLEYINLNIQDQIKYLIAITMIINTTSITSNMLYIKYTDISITKKEFFISYIQKIIIIIFIYSIIYYLYKGYIS